MRLVIAFALVGCHHPEPGPSPALSSHPPTIANKNLELVARCATQAAELLGWNPLPDGAHQGMVIETALAHGASADCKPLATEANASKLAVGGDVIDWSWEPSDDPVIHYTFSCTGCTSIATTVTLPRRWHCFGWAEREHSGTYCFPDAATCEKEQARTGPSTPCALRTGAAWCQHGTTTCSDSPWSCADSPTRAACDKR